MARFQTAVRVEDTAHGPSAGAPRPFNGLVEDSRAFLDQAARSSRSDGELQLASGFVPHVAEYLDTLFKKMATTLAKNPAAIAAHEEYQRTQPKWEWPKEIL